MTRLEGKVALITGGARGLGAETVRRFVAEVANLVLFLASDEASYCSGTEYIIDGATLLA